MCEIKIPINANRILRWLICTALGLTLASAIGQYLKFHYEFEWIEPIIWLINLVDVDREGNLPTWYSSSMILICAALLWTAGRLCDASGERWARYWKMLSAIFVLLSIDEAAAIHEKTILPLRSLLQTSGLLFFPWILPAALFVIILSIVYWRFFFDLPRKVRTLFACAGILYLLGTLGLEAVSGLLAERHGFLEDGSVGFGEGFQMLATVEELMEMLGVVLFIYGLLLYLGWQDRVLRLCIGEGKHEHK